MEDVYKVSVSCLWIVEGEKKVKEIPKHSWFNSIAAR